MPITTNPYTIIAFSVLIGALIGYVTNAIAIWMLFHPRKKVWGLQGVIPKRKEKLATNISQNIQVILPPAYKKITDVPFVGKGVDHVFKDSIKKTILKTRDEELESLIKKVVDKEFFMLKILGAILGALIGLIQGLLLM